MNKKIIGANKIVHIEDNIKGVMVLLDGLAHAEETGAHPFQKDAYYTLHYALEKALKDLSTIKDSVSYMQNTLQKN